MYECTKNRIRLSPSRLTSRPSDKEVRCRRKRVVLKNITVNFRLGNQSFKRDFHTFPGENTRKNVFVKRTLLLQHFFVTTWSEHLV